MENQTTMQTDENAEIWFNLFGRLKIYTTTEEITADNVIEEVNAVLGVHCKNLLEEEFLYWYRRGLQPILERTKQIRPEINNKIVENIASSIVAFKNGYFMPEDANYIARKEDPVINEKVNRLNEYLYLSGKHEADNEVVDWFHTVGLGNLYIKPNDDKNIPFKVYALDPRQSFVVYSRRPGNEPVMGINIVASGTGESKGAMSEVLIDVFTKKNVFRLMGSMTSRIVTGTPIMATATSIVGEVETNAIGEIPIIEYQYEQNRMGAFESTIPLQMALCEAQSNRMDGIAQFVQSLMVFYNCDLGNDENGNPITPGYIRAAGAIFLKSTGQESRADMKILSDQLDQQQTQVFVNDLYDKILSISGMPTTTKGGASTSDTGTAVWLRDGWQNATTFARCTEDLFKVSNRRFDKVMLKIINNTTDLNLSLDEFELQFTRTETENLLAKTQAAMNLKQLGFSPELAFAKSGVSDDPVADVENSRKYIDMMWNASDNTEIIDENRVDDVAPV